MRYRSIGVIMVFLWTVSIWTGGPTSIEAQIVWTELKPGGADIVPRRAVVAVYEPESDRIVFQGGQIPSIISLSQDWQLDLSTNEWVEFPGAEPSAVCHHTMVTDAMHGRALRFGGFPRTDELWSWNPQAESWTDITPAFGPSPRCLHAVALSAARGEMIMYGGVNGATGQPDRSDTWSYDLEANSWNLILADSPPGQRHGHAMTLDAARDRVVMFGGLWRTASNQFIHRNDLWIFDLETREWTEIPVVGPSPSARREAKVATLPDGSGMILFGGIEDGVFVPGGLPPIFHNDLWVLRFEDMTWEEIPTTGPRPPARFRHTVILDEGGNRLWTGFGSGANNEFFNDIWELDLSGLVSGPPFMRGDADGDAVFNGLNDGLYLLNFQFVDGPEPPCMEAADANGDGVINGLVDALYILEHQFLAGPAPAPPFPDCGVDRDPGSLGCLTGCN